MLGLQQDLYDEIERVQEDKGKKILRIIDHIKTDYKLLPGGRLGGG